MLHGTMSPLSAQQPLNNCLKHTFSLPISTFSTLGVSHVMRYMNLRYLLQDDHPTGKPGKVRELESGRGKVRESYNHHLAGARVAKILPHFIISSFSSLIFSNQRS